MRKHLLAAVLILPALSSAAKPEPAPAEEKEAVIVPLNVRDPSALVMGPMGEAGPAVNAVDALPQPPAAGPWLPVPERKGERAAMPKGYRSVSVPVPGDELMDLRPGDRVDLVSIFEAQGAKGKERFAATVLQNVKVLGLGAPKGAEGHGAALLMLNPMEAQMALLAVRQGPVGLARRGPGDDEIYPMEMTSYRRLFR
jgi:hypothetical protein